MSNARNLADLLAPGENTLQTVAIETDRIRNRGKNKKQYKISFEAKAEEDKRIILAFGDALSVDPWFTDYIEKTIFELTTELQLFELVFTMEEVSTDDQGKLVFEIGTSGNTLVTIDNIRIEEYDGNDIIEGTDQVSNGDFGE